MRGSLEEVHARSGQAGCVSDKPSGAPASLPVGLLPVSPPTGSRGFLVGGGFKREGGKLPVLLKVRPRMGIQSLLHTVLAEAVTSPAQIQGMKEIDSIS